MAFLTLSPRITFDLTAPGTFSWPYCPKINFNLIAPYCVLGVNLNMFQNKHLRRKNFVLWTFFSYFFPKSFRIYILDQGSQTRGPQATCGPPDAFVRPRNTSKNAKSIMFDQIKLILRAFLVYCGPQKLFSYKLRPADHSISRMWPSDQFEFETPVLDSVSVANYFVAFSLFLSHPWHRHSKSFFNLLHCWVSMLGILLVIIFVTFLKHLWHQF